MRSFTFLIALSNIIPADLIIVDVDETTCTSYDTDGIVTFCCDGACLDNSTLGGPDLCEYWTQICQDAVTTPQCPSDQVFYTAGYTWVDSGNDNCYLPAIDDCDWRRNDWHCSIQ